MNYDDFIETQVQDLLTYYPINKNPLNVYIRLLEDKKFKVFIKKLTSDVKKFNLNCIKLNNKLQITIDSLDELGELISDIFESIKINTCTALLDVINKEKYFGVTNYGGYLNFYITTIDKIIHNYKQSKINSYVNYLDLELILIQDFLKQKQIKQNSTWLDDLDLQSQKRIDAGKIYFESKDYKKTEAELIFKEIGTFFKANNLFNNTPEEIVNIFVNKIYFKKINWQIKYKKKNIDRKAILTFFYVLMQKGLLVNIWSDKKKLLESIVGISNRTTAKDDYQSFRKSYEELVNYSSGNLVSNTKNLSKGIEKSIDKVLSKF